VTRAHFVIGLGALALAACGGDFAVADYTAVDAGGTPACTVATDCGAGEECQFGVCVPESSEQVVVSLDIRPPEFRTDLVRQQITGLPVRLGTEIPDFELARPIVVNGSIAYDDGSGVPVQATVRFRGVSGIPGEAYSANTRTDTGGSDFVIELPPGLYDVTVIDDRQDVGRIIRRGVTISPEAQRARPCDDRICQAESFVVPAPQSYVRVQGQLSRRAPSLVPVEGARISAVSADGRFESTDDVTDAGGVFDLLVPPGLDAIEFRMRADDGFLLPTLVFPAVAPPAEEGAPIDLVIGPWDGVIELGGVIGGATELVETPILLAARVERVVTAGVLGAETEVTARYDLPLGAVTADGSGAFALSLPVGTTELLAVPADGSLEPGLARIDTLALIESEATSASIEFRMRPPVRLTGEVFATFTGDVTPDATVEATWIGPLDAEWGPVPAAALDRRTTANALGAYTLDLPRGRWQLAADAPAGTGTARWVRELAEVRDDAVLDIALPTAGVARGRVLDNQRQPVAGATIQAWVEVDGTPQLIWRTLTNDEGVYDLLLPADAPPQAR
jgi:hypothetical protein